MEVIMTEYKFFDALPDDARMIRTEVFCDEQGFIEEFDSIDDTAVHVVAYYNGEPAATGRIFTEDDPTVRHIGRVAVRKKFRGLKIGEGVMMILEASARESGAEYTELSSQCQARGFYEKCGYTAHGDIYMDQHCPHILMKKRLI